MRELDELGERFWAWRARQQPRTRDDILRVRGIPRFWTDQALGPVFDALLRPGVDAARVAEVTRLLRAVPDTLSHAADALVSPAREFAKLAVAELDGIAG